MQGTHHPARYAPGPRRGDVRRAALLSSLEELLATQPLAGVSILDITRAAGVTRPAFYFYFPSKAAAVAALLEEIYDEALLLASDWYDGGDGTPQQRLTGGFHATLGLWRRHASLLRAMLDAIATDDEVRSVWSGWIDGFIARIAGRIIQEQAADLTHPIPDATALATVLMGAVLHAMDQIVRSDPSDTAGPQTLVDALVLVWQRAIYRGR
jgi:AcrR family transcriptional regulator